MRNDDARENIEQDRGGDAGSARGRGEAGAKVTPDDAGGSRSPWMRTPVPAYDRAIREFFSAPC